MSALAPRLRAVAASAAMALGAIFFTVTPVVAQTAAPAPAASSVPTLAPMLERVMPAVVNIAVVSRTPAEDNPLYSDPYFRRFFNLPEQQPQARISAGSGVIVDADKGYVLTNYHVVDGGSEITVTLKDGRQFRARVVGSDKDTDIALLQIKASGLSAVQIGDSDSLRVGDYVVAIGNPFALGQTATSGIVSALGRSGLNIEGYEDFIQTDASINPGNSGGALVTLDGKLVGINTAILSPAGGNVGIGFAVPSNMAVAVMKQLVEYGEVRRGHIGIGIRDVTPDVAQALKLGDVRGAVVAKVEPGSSAQKAELKVGDVVTAIDGRPVHSAADLRNRIGLTPAGTEVTLTVMRSGSKRQIKLRVTPGANTASSVSGTLFDGATLRKASPDEAGDAGSGGVVVESVAKGSPAARAGLRPGDMILSINRIPMKSVDDIRRWTSDRPTTLVVELVRNGDRLLLIIR